MDAITKTVHQQMLAALRAVREADLDSYETLLPPDTRAVVCDAIAAAEALPYTRAMAAADAVLPTTTRVELVQPARADPPFMTLSEFRASGREVNHRELEEVAGTDLGHEQGGRVYAGRCYIEHYADEWALTIMNDSWTGPLKTLEAILYDFARIEVLPRLTGADEEQALIDEWATFCKDEGLPHIDAQELLHMLMSDLEQYSSADTRQVLDAQVAYTRGYIQRWDHWAKQQ